MEALTKGYEKNRDRIQSNRDGIQAVQAGIGAVKTGVRTLLALTAFGAIVWGIPIAEVKWSGEEFSFTRDTTDPSLVIVGGLVAAAVVSGDKPIDLLKIFMTTIQKK